MKRLLSTILLIFCVTVLTACDPSTVSHNSEESSNEVPFEAYIDGNALITMQSGAPFTEDEIISQIEIAKDFVTTNFKSGTFISTHGYYLPESNDKSIFNYSRYNLPIVYNNAIVGECIIGRDSSGNATIADYVIENTRVEALNEALKAHTSVILVYANASYYAINESNTIITLKGDDTPTIKNPDKLYDTWNLEYNLLTGDVFNSEDAYYTVP